MSRETPPNATDDTRNALLDAARELFLKNSYANISIRRIADRAKVNSAMIAYYFGSKSGLFREVIRRYVTAQLNLATENLQQANRMSLAEFLKHFYLNIPPELAHLIFRTLYSERNEMREWLLKEMLKPALDKVEAMAQSIIVDGGKAVDPLLLRMTMQSMLLAPKLMQPVLEEIDPERITPEFYERLAGFHADLIATYFNLESR